MAIKLDLLQTKENKNRVVLNDKYLSKIYINTPKENLNQLVEWLNSSDGNKRVFTEKDKQLLKTYNIPESFKDGIFGPKICIIGIGDSLFENCNLETITIPQTIYKIGKRAFRGCPLKTLIIPHGVLYIDDFAFEDCKNLSYLEIPQSVKIIGDNAFSGCTSLEKVKIPDSVIKIGDNAFKCVANIVYNGGAEGKPWGAEQREEKEANRKAEEDRAKAEAERKKLEDELEAKNRAEAKRKAEEEAKRKARENAQREAEELERSTPKPLILDEQSIKHLYELNLIDSNDKNEITSLFIPSNYIYEKQKYKIVEIKPFYFRNSSLKSLIVNPDSVEIIGKYAFKNCISLKEINIKDIIQIAEGTFKDCSSLKNVLISSELLVQIENSVFENCKGLEYIKIPDGVTIIGKNAFRNCRSLKEITIPSSVTTIKSGAFSNCKSLKKVVISSGVKIIEESVFEDCDSLEEIKVPLSVEKIEDYAFLNIKIVYYNGTAEGSPWGADIVKNYSEDIKVNDSNLYSSEIDI